MQYEVVHLDIVSTLIDWGYQPVNIYNVCRRVLKLSEDYTVSMLMAFGLM